jgi:hypothetical protein
MSKRLSYVTVAFGLCFMSNVYSDAAYSEIATPEVSAIEAVEISTTAPSEEPALVQQIVTPVVPIAPVVVERPFSPFTGKVKGKKVRLRANADLESRVVKELNRNDLIVINGEKGDFYSVEPPSGSKAYVFRSFVLDGVVEGNRVNVRLEPSLDSPIIGHLNSGDRIKGAISSLNSKWYEISPPSGTRFYIAKEFVQSIGGPEVKVQLDKRRNGAEQLLDAAALLTQVEMKKSYRDMDIDRIKHNYQAVINDYTDFPELVEKAKEAFNILQEEYTQRKISFLEEKSDERVSIGAEKTSTVEVAFNATDRMKMWDPVEESLYLSWASRNEDRALDEFYEHEKQNSYTISGIVEPYAAPVKRKPGDFVVKDKDLPVAYVYSTHINLQEYAGKKVTLRVAPRSNNNFAFPAYFVLSVE